MTIGDIIDIFNFLGITVKGLVNLIPLFLGLLVFYYFLSKGINKVKDRVEGIEKAVIEIQTILRNKHSTIQQSIGTYGKSNSPISLKDEFRKFIAETNLGEQIKEKEESLLKWLRDQGPQTGLDAQDSIANLVASDEISKYLDLKEYKQYLYKNGKTSEDADGILAVYLFEVLIPALNIPDGDKK
jgi:hypothetical protein